ncbi:MAG: hypothetical protein HC774_00970, partial [Sphingomonadales bacterium]|nr:hypothetical protein [Sphingomonadales bacterium]
MHIDQPDRLGGRFDGINGLVAFSERFPLAQGLCVAWRDVGVLGVFADGGQDLPRPRAFGAPKAFRPRRDTRYVGELEGVRRRVVVGYHRIRCDADFCQVDVEHHVEDVLVRDMDERR